MSHSDESMEWCDLATAMKHCRERASENGSAGPTSWKGSIWVQLERNTKKASKSGKPYLEWHLRDASQSVMIRVWENHPQWPGAETCPAESFVSIQGNWSLGEFGFEGRDWNFRHLDAEEIDVLLMGSAEARADWEKDVEDCQTLWQSISDPRLHGLAALFWKKHHEAFGRAAGARDFHHAKRGGLLQHSTQMMRAADAISKVYPNLNRDLLILGAMLHDCGKIWENGYPKRSFQMPYQLSAEMLGHIVIGIQVINQLWNELLTSAEAESWSVMEPASEEIKWHLLHLIASHHGELAYGSPVLPKTPEGIALHYLDNLDAKLEMMRHGYETSAKLADGIFERVRPLSQRLVKPLAPYLGEVENLELPPYDVE